MKIITTETQKILAAENDKWLFNGSTYGKTVVMSLNGDGSNWREVDEEELPKEEVTFL
jgi:hypothetical protein